MKRTQKKVLGAFGLSVVAATTVFAAFLPTPVTQATSTMTDTFTVRVVGASPDITITDITGEEDELKPDKDIHYDYSNANTVVITLEYTDGDGNTTTETLDTIDADYAVGSGDLSLDLTQPQYGYGDYTVKITGYGPNGVSDEDIVEFSFLPVTAAAEDSDVVDGPEVTLTYDPENSDIASFEINVYDKNGNLIKELSPATVNVPDTTINLDFGKYGLDSGDYLITVTALDADGNALYKPYPVPYKYVAEEYEVPNTGGFFQGMNISKADYLVTGLVGFGILTVAGMMFVARNGKQGKNRK